MNRKRKMPEEQNRIARPREAPASAPPPRAAKAEGRRGRPKLDHPKEAITLRLDHELISHFKNKGRHWRAEMRKALISAMQTEEN